MVRIALLPLVLALFALASLTAAWNARIPLSSFAPAMDAVEDPALVARAMRDRLGAGQIQLPPVMAQTVRLTARRAPLDDSFALLAALEKRAEGNNAEALVLLELARARDPRNRITRALLLEAYLQAGDAGAAAAEIVVLDRLSPGAQHVLFPILWRLIELPATRAAAIAAIPDSSRLRRQLAQAVATEQLAPELILALQDLPTAQDRSEADRRWIESLILPYVQSGNVEAAMLLSRHFYSLEGAIPGLLSDPDFSGFPGPPFGWNLDARQGGLVELRRDGLWVSHYGRSSWLVARQVLRLNPGSYQLGYSLAQGASDRPNLVWRVDCIESGARLLDLPLNRERAFGMAPIDRFAVPAQGCPAQWLVLAGRADGAASARSVTFRAVEITPAAGF